MMGKISQRRGKTGQQIAEYLLRLAGVEMVEQISTPFVVTDRRTGGWIRIKYSEKVSGDIRGILPNGIRVLCEVKLRDRNLRKSDFYDHQLEKLQKNHLFGGVSLVVWVHPEGNLILRWPFYNHAAWLEEGARASLTFDEAREMYEWDGRS